MKELLFSLLLIGIAKGVDSLQRYNHETGSRKIISILEYRYRAALLGRSAS